MYVIAGLGNPTKEYEQSRHNVGFDVIDRLSDKIGCSVDESKHKAICGKGIISGQKVILVKPQTYMNNSGESIRAVVDFYKIEPEDIIIISDDIDQEPGHIRLRKTGSAGGHNGIKSIIQHLGSQDFSRVRVGVGAKPSGWDLADYVLGRPTPEERKLIDAAEDYAVSAVMSIVADGIDEAMNIYNSNKGKASQ